MKIKPGNVFYHHSSISDYLVILRAEAISAKGPFVIFLSSKGGVHIRLDNESILQRDYWITYMTWTGVLK